MTGTEDLREMRTRVLAESYRLFYSEPVNLVSGEGVWLRDAEGRQYLDAYNNVPSVGHGNPRVVAAMTAQAGRLNVHTRYLGEEVVAYGARLLSRFPDRLDRVVLTCTGSEANDLAFRMARHVTGASGAVVTANAYHGVTGEIAGLSPSLSPDLALTTRAVPAPDPRLGTEAGRRFADDVRAAVADLRAAGMGTAMLMLDTALSSDGIITDPLGMFDEAVAVVREAGGIYVADEVQAGFGRLGDGLWGFDRHGLVPDIVTLGKPMGNGYPMAGVVTSSAVARSFGERFRYFNTFGGSSVAGAVGSAVLDEIEERNLVASCGTVGRYLREGLNALAGRHDAIGDVRGAGLFAGVDVLGRDEGLSGARAAQVVDRMRAGGVLISATGPTAATLKIRPPLVFETAHADHLLDRLDAVMTSLDKEIPR